MHITITKSLIIAGAMTLGLGIGTVALGQIGKPDMSAKAGEKVAAAMSAQAEARLEADEAKIKTLEAKIAAYDAKFASMSSEMTLLSSALNGVRTAYLNHTHNLVSQERFVVPTIPCGGGFGGPVSCAPYPWPFAKGGAPSDSKSFALLPDVTGKPKN